MLGMLLSGVTFGTIVLLYAYIIQSRIVAYLTWSCFISTLHKTFGILSLWGSGINMFINKLISELWLTIGTERFWQISAGPHISSLGRIHVHFAVIVILGHHT